MFEEYIKTYPVINPADPAAAFDENHERPLYLARDILARIYRVTTYTIYPFGQLWQLLAELASPQNPEDDPDYKYRIRFLIDADLVIWFAREGIADHTIPAHYQMTGMPLTTARCIAAGNITFSNDFTEIIGFNHKSGDFRAPFNTVKWALALFFANEHACPTPLAKEIMVEELNGKGGTAKEFIFQTNTCRDWITSRSFYQTYLPQFRQQPHALRTVHYQPERSKERSQSLGFFDPLRRLSLLPVTAPLSDDSSPDSSPRSKSLDIHWHS